MFADISDLGQERNDASDGYLNVNEISGSNLPIPEPQSSKRSGTANSKENNENITTYGFESIKREKESKAEIRRLWKTAVTKVISGQYMERNENLKTNDFERIKKKQRTKATLQTLWKTAGTNVISSEIDLRALPINLDECEEGFTEVMNVKGVVKALKYSGKLHTLKNTSEAEKLRRQEEKLQMFSSIYDPLSGTRVHYLELEKSQKEDHDQIQSKYFQKYHTVHSRKNKCSLQ